MKPSRIERIKLFSNYLNGIAVAVFAIGGFGFLFNLMQSGEQINKKSLIIYSSAATLSLLCHIFAQIRLLRLDREEE